MVLSLLGDAAFMIGSSVLMMVDLISAEDCGNGTSNAADSFIDSK